jgi:hypothetical protein
MVESGIQQLWVTSYNISYPCIERTPMITIEEEVFLDKEGIEVRFCCACPVVMCG